MGSSRPGIALGVPARMTAGSTAYETAQPTRAATASSRMALAFRATPRRAARALSVHRPFGSGAHHVEGTGSMYRIQNMPKCSPVKRTWCGRLSRSELIVGASRGHGQERAVHVTEVLSAAHVSSTVVLHRGNHRGSGSSWLAKKAARYTARLRTIHEMSPPDETSRMSSSGRPTTTVAPSRCRAARAVRGGARRSRTPERTKKRRKMSASAEAVAEKGPGRRLFLPWEEVDDGVHRKPLHVVRHALLHRHLGVRAIKDALERVGDQPIVHSETAVAVAAEAAAFAADGARTHDVGALTLHLDDDAVGERTHRAAAAAALAAYLGAQRLDEAAH
eukprot:5628655-Prymnesium_polylepis.1